MNHDNVYIASLALATFGNIASAEMASDLHQEIQRLLQHANAHLRKRAVLCALRIVARAPELHVHFVSAVKGCLADKQHGVQLAGATLMTELCLLHKDVRQTYRPVRCTHACAEDVDTDGAG